MSELQPLLTQLPSTDPILFHQIREGLPLLTISPDGWNGEYHLESRRVDSPPESISTGHMVWPSSSIKSWDFTAQSPCVNASAQRESCQ